MPTATIIDSASAQSGDTLAAGVTGLNVTGAGLIVIHVANYASSTLASHLTVSPSNTFTKVNTYAVSGDVQSTLFYKWNPAVGGGSMDITYTGVIANYPTLSVIAFGNIVSGVFDVDNGANATAAGQLSAGSVTPGAADSIIVTGLGWYANNTMFIDSGFTIQEETGYTGGVGMGGALAYLLQGSPSAVNPLWAWSGNNNAAAGIAVFSPIYAAGGGNPWYYYAQQLARPRLPRWLRSPGGILMPRPLAA